MRNQVRLQDLELEEVGRKGERPGQPVHIDIERRKAGNGTMDARLFYHDAQDGNAQTSRVPFRKPAPMFHFKRIHQSEATGGVGVEPDIEIPNGCVFKGNRERFIAGEEDGTNERAYRYPEGYSVCDEHWPAARVANGHAGSGQARQPEALNTFNLNGPSKCPFKSLIDLRDQESAPRRAICVEDDARDQDAHECREEPNSDPKDTKRTRKKAPMHPSRGVGTVSTGH